MRAQKKLSPDEIERRLIDDARNPDAWEPAIRVGPARSQRPSFYGKTIVMDRHPRSRRADSERKEQALRRKRLHDAVAELPEAKRLSLQLWLDGFDYNEISTVLGISVSAVKSKVSDARNRLQSRLDDSEH
jgi:RNA polymerase sigma factor (sigma-70 family)